MAAVCQLMIVSTSCARQAKQCVRADDGQLRDERVQPIIGLALIALHCTTLIALHYNMLTEGALLGHCALGTGHCLQTVYFRSTLDWHGH